MTDDVRIVVEEAAASCVPSASTVVRVEGPVPFVDEEDLPIVLALRHDLSTRHPLGRNRKYHVPPECPKLSDTDTDVDDDACPGSYFAQCLADCVLCRGVVNEDWQFELP